LAELTGAAEYMPRNIDGLSILPTLLGPAGTQLQHDYLYWAFYERGGAQAARMGRWKAVHQPNDSPVRLYDLVSDIGEERDLAAQHPGELAKLVAAMKQAYVPNENWKFVEPPAVPAGKKKSATKASGR
jgi:arylsulfatase A-like enzyme